GKSAPSPVAGTGAAKRADVTRLSRVKTMQFGEDVAIIGYCEA
ncbi:MAG: riboflavin biosynthesis protein RibD, partial [Chloroflexi bacterium]|nr:riboflavin biosynthesis protein RibD [Chloroflexota bacterium]